MYTAVPVCAYKFIHSCIYLGSNHFNMRICGMIHYRIFYFFYLLVSFAQPSYYKNLGMT